MKHTYLLGGLILTILLTMVGCGSTNNSEKEHEHTNAEGNFSQNENKEAQGREEIFGLNDTVEVEGFTFTITGVSLTDERVEDSVQNPNQVVRIDYEIKNDSESKEILLGRHLVVYDNTEKEVNMYPFGYTVGILSSGDEVTDGVIHFGIEDGPIEVHFKPLEDSDAAAIYQLDIE